MNVPDPRFTVTWDAVDPYDPDFPHLWIKVEHLGRYLFAARYLEYCKAEVVADVGCGRGYGTRELSEATGRVIAIDNDADMLRYSRDRYAVPNVEYVQSALGPGELRSQIPLFSVDACVCFETIEHLIDPASALGEIARITRIDGTLIISVPSGVAERLNDTGLPSNRHHRRIFSVSAIRELVESAGFEVSEVLGQPITAEIARNETMLIRRRQTDARIGDEPVFHEPETIRRLAMTVGYPEARDIERSYSIIVVARRLAA